MALYKFNGPKNPADDNTEVLSLSDDRYAGVGDEIELSDDEHKQLAKTLKLSKVDESADSKTTTSPNEASNGTVDTGRGYSK